MTINIEQASALNGSTGSVSINIPSGSDRVVITAFSQFRSPNRLTSDPADYVLGGNASTGVFLQQSSIYANTAMALAYWLDEDLPAGPTANVTWPFNNGDDVIFIAANNVQQQPHGIFLHDDTGGEITFTISGGQAGALMACAGYNRGGDGAGEALSGTQIGPLDDIVGAYSLDSDTVTLKVDTINALEAVGIAIMFNPAGAGATPKAIFPATELDAQLAGIVGSGNYQGP